MVKEDNEKTPFTCELCKFKTGNKKDFARHMGTKKHLKMEELRENDNKKTLLPITAHQCNCGKKYNFSSGLSRHKKRCASETENNASGLIFKLLLRLSDSQKRVVELLTEKNMQLLTENNGE